jgi:hypothetical protein
VFDQFEQSLREMIDASGGTTEEFVNAAKSYLGAIRDSELERSEVRLENVVAKKKAAIQISTDDDASTVVIDPSARGAGDSVSWKWNTAQGSVRAVLSPEALSARSIILLGMQFKVHYVTSSRPGAGAVSFNFEGREVFVNLFSPDLARFNLTILDVYIALEVACAMSRGDAVRMKKLCLNMLGTGRKAGSDMVKHFHEKLGMVG